MKKWLFFSFAALIMIGCGSERVLSRVDVTPANVSVSMSTSISQQFEATAFYDNGDQEDVTTTATWSGSDSSSDALLVSDIPGLVGITQTGNFIILASYSDSDSDTSSDVSGFANLQVTN